MAHSTKSKRKPPKTAGRPSLYDPDEHPRVARLLTGQGKTKQDVAEALEIARSTLDEWRSVHPAFSVAFDLGKEDATDRVERSLLERATGYTLDTIKPMVVSQGGDMGSTVEMVDVKVHYPPDTAAAALWLKNRRAKEWRDRQEIEHSGTLTLEQILAVASKPDEAKK